MTDLDSLNRLTEAYDSQVHAIRQQITAFGQAYWDSLPPHPGESALFSPTDAHAPLVGEEKSIRKAVFKIRIEAERY